MPSSRIVLSAICYRLSAACCLLPAACSIMRDPARHRRPSSYHIVDVNKMVPHQRPAIGYRLSAACCLLSAIGYPLYNARLRRAADELCEPFRASGYSLSAQRKISFRRKAEYRSAARRNIAPPQGGISLRRKAEYRSPAKRENIAPPQGGSPQNGRSSSPGSSPNSPSASCALSFGAAAASDFESTNRTAETTTSSAKCFTPARSV